MGNTKQRQSNIELFRIITMILIIMHHYVVNSGLISPESPVFKDGFSLKPILFLIAGGWGKIGINCFVLITGYFMCKSNITLKKFCKLFFEVMFYRIIIYSAFLIAGEAEFSFVKIVKNLVPIISIGQNFTGCFLMFFLCIPFLNTLISSIDEKKHIYLLVLLLFIYTFFETVPYFSIKMNYVSWFSVLYLIAAYIRIYPKKIYFNAKIWRIISGFSIAVSVASIVMCYYIFLKTGKNIIYYFVTDSNTFLALVCGVSFFMLAVNTSIKQSKFINNVAATSFGVLLIHANSDVMRKWLWTDTLQNVRAYCSDYAFLHILLSVICVFICCSTIDTVRIKFIEKPFFKLFDKFEPKLVSKYIEIERNIGKMINNLLAGGENI